VVELFCGVVERQRLHCTITSCREWHMRIARIAFYDGSALRNTLARLFRSYCTLGWCIILPTTTHLQDCMPTHRMGTLLERGMDVKKVEVKI